MRRFVLAAVLCFTSVATAQEAQAPVVAPPPPAPPAPAVEAPLTALRQRSGSVGVGYLGLGSVSAASSLAGLSGLGGLVGGGLLRVSVPVLGARWWLPGSRLALEFGVGVMGSSFSVAGDNGAPSIQVLGHVAMPIAVASTQHVIVFVAPQLRAGVSTLSSTSGISGTGSLLELGVAGGVELFFGFIGVPALSLEAGVRVGVARDASVMEVSAPLSSTIQSSRSESWRFSTSLSGDPGSIVASTLALKYYF